MGTMPTDNIRRCKGRAFHPTAAPNVRNWIQQSTKTSIRPDPELIRPCNPIQ